MKLANLFLITALVGVLGAIGCSTDSGNGAGGAGGAGGDGGSVGNGGSGGGGGNGGMAACTGGECASDADRKAACEAGIAYCNSLGAGGGGGAGGTPTESQCDALGNKICDIETGTGGAGGTGGTPGGCDWTAEEVCAQCDNASASGACESFFGNCLENPPSGGEACDKCAVLALSECGI